MADAQQAAAAPAASGDENRPANEGDAEPVSNAKADGDAAAAAAAPGGTAEGQPLPKKTTKVPQQKYNNVKVRPGQGAGRAGTSRV